MATNLTGTNEKEPEKKPAKKKADNLYATGGVVSESVLASFGTEDVPELIVPLETIEQLIYVGPNLPGAGLSRFTVFREGVPAYLADVLEKQPAIKILIVPVAEMSATMTRVATPGTLEHSAYQELQKGMK
ncbi:hypothetical protein WJ0W_003282 [Paenibacillus melissococcoides]|uniref:Uncharacterized protein n=1 Tax=Paenibacillus melissococcoides TaxID=2912268 RepID=A0ABM9G3D7_9BACL|nr:MULTISPECIES: hypothetical protein [Paenibacillus]MEB9893282.1 hypothetical protein [Bacillus cereus]CAH8246045.1 hypothetical protein WJ0W_003282 [Paenibacillus melissococcoides]CAH8712810.1 hypothetical protein WDD9_003361 [Paenibacillus melissococcoides]CAH8713578.1 hypothetical protein HTL2_003664 [Paenibacillus melissococcoides]GIO78761.1 hypothetical protein J6TS7_23710 [Paenibacillus dendritiformis]